MFGVFIAFAALAARHVDAVPTSLIITAPVDLTSFQQMDDIAMEWTADPPEAFDPLNPETVTVFKCQAPSSTLTCSLNVACSSFSHQTNNDLKTTLVTRTNFEWTSPAGSIYLCIKLDSNPDVFAYSGQLTAQEISLAGVSITKPKNIGQFDPIKIKWAAPGLGPKGELTLYRCTTVEDATISCSLNEKCEEISSTTNKGYAKETSSYKDTYASHLDDANPYTAQWTSDVGDFNLCLSVDATLTLPTPIFQYSPYSVSKASLDLQKPDSDSCYAANDPARVKWDGNGGSEYLILYKCKGSKSNTDAPCSQNPDCNTLPGAGEWGFKYVLNSGLALVATTSSTGLTGKVGNYYMCAASAYAEEEVYSYGGVYTVTAADEACPLSEGEIAAVSVGSVLVFGCLVAACYCAWNKSKN
mmetsp:Transcript_73536/g.143872  ORF Transcript_73536/g.143872 Transcript_73536/m.143872 type:complete len:414 (-) Transcript_73536:198-1439(-)